MASGQMVLEKVAFYDADLPAHRIVTQSLTGYRSGRREFEQRALQLRVTTQQRFEERARAPAQVQHPPVPAEVIRGGQGEGVTEALLARKSGGKDSKLCYSGNLLVENRNGLIVEAEVFQANGTAERDAALVMLEQIPGTKPVTVGGDKGLDTRGFVADCRHLRVTPHVAQNHARPGGSALDGRTTRHPGYAISQRKRKRIEECFGWLKTIALMRKVRHRGVCKVDWIFTFACAAYNLVRMRNLAAAVPAL